MNSNILQHIKLLTRSSIILSPIIDSFYENFPIKEKNFLLGYLILPIVLHNKSRKFLINSNSNSSLITFCKIGDTISDLPKRVHDLKEISNNSILVSISCNRLCLNKDLSLVCLKENFGSKKKVEISDERKSAKNLAKLLYHYDVVTIFRILGLKKL